MNGPIEVATPVIGKPALRWSSRARSVAGIEAELQKIWGSISLTRPNEDGEAERRVAIGPLCCFPGRYFSDTR